MHFDYHILLQYYPLLLSGLAMTIMLTVIALLAGITIGLVVCVARMSGYPVASGPAKAYTNFFRATPEMMLIFWIYFCAPPLLNIRLSAMATGTVALSLVAGAYLAEIFRAGIQSLPRGQIEAARALALPAFARWGFVLLPQAVRLMLPAFVTYLTELLKNTTLLSAIGVAELAYQASILGAQTFRYMEFLTAIAVGYFVVIFPISMVARYAKMRVSISGGS
jgi:His/Glu/Gln/Arg/opine family amino acid ABC transporter permease subunit